MRLRLFRSPMFVMLVLLHAYIGIRLLVPFGAVTQVAGVGLLAGCLWLLPQGFRIRKDRGPWAVLLPSLAVGFFSWLLVLTLFRDVSLVVSALALSRHGTERTSSRATTSTTPGSMPGSTSCGDWARACC